MNKHVVLLLVGSAIFTLILLENTVITCNGEKLSLVVQGSKWIRIPQYKEEKVEAGIGWSSPKTKKDF
jgi:uncharacterized membrane protein (Fun14 family)